MRVLIVDDVIENMIWAEQALRQAMPDAVSIMWNPEKQGRPPRGFDWKRYDCVLLAETPLPGEDALLWLNTYHDEPGFPPTIVLAEAAGEDASVKLMRAGAHDVLRKNDITPVKLAMSVREAKLETQRNAPAPVSPEGIGQPADPGLYIDGYRVLRRIGEGGMSKVYLAERDEDGLQMVLKVLHADMRDDPHLRARLEREYRIIERIRNEHVAVIYGHGFGGEQAYIAMEYFGGGDLQQRIRRGMTSMTAMKIMMQIAQALDAIHTAGVVHRDLKPQNIMFRANNRLAILDFGLAREMDATSTLTQKGMVMATPLYMSPEQCVGRPHDPRGDLYSTGVILYEMLTGRHLFSGENASQLAYQHVHAPIPMLPGRLSGYQPLLERLVAKKPEDRFQSARELYSFVVH